MGAVGADFTGASFKGTTVMNADLTGAKFDSAKFIGNSSIQSVNNASFAGAEFSGTTGITNASQSDFTDAKFKAGSVTTFNNSMAGASFLRTRFESGSSVKMDSTDLSGAAFDGKPLPNNATPSTHTAASGIRLVNSTINAGGKLTVTSDGWVRNWSNAVIENNNFAGDVFFGVTEQDNRDYNSFNLTGASFAGTTFGGNTNFRWVNLNNASFQNTILGGTVDFTGKIGPYKERVAGNFASANFNGSTLSGSVTFTDMLMNNATFDGAQLSGDVTFRTVNLDGNGYGTNMTGADFRSTGALATNITGNLLFDLSLIHI